MPIPSPGAGSVRYASNDECHVPSILSWGAVMLNASSDPGASESKPKVAVFRHRLFAPSETFIREQATALENFQAVFVGRDRLQDVPHGAAAVSMAPEGAIRRHAYALTGYSPKLRAILHSELPALVHAHFGPDALSVSSEARRLGIPVIATLHGRDVTVSRKALYRSGRPVGIRYATLRPRLGSRVSVLLCVSDEIRRAAIEAGIEPRQLRTHYIGVDTDRFSENLRDRSADLVHVARLVEKKGTSDLLEAFAKARHSLPDTRLHIIGDGPLRSGLEAQARALGITGAVDFLGAQPSSVVREKVEGAAAFVLPSKVASDGDKEGLPIALLEAMALGTPPISTRHSGIPEAVASPDYGWLVNEGDVASLSAMMIEAVRDKKAAREVGARAAKRVRLHFNLGMQTRLLEEIYTEMI